MAKLTLLSALVALQLLFTASAYFQCPTLFDFYPDQANCGSFFRCFWGTPYQFNCPAGTYWSQQLRTCDHTYNAACLHMAAASVQTTNYQSYGYGNGVAAVAPAVNTAVHSSSQYVGYANDGYNGYGQGSWAAQGGAWKKK